MSSSAALQFIRGLSSRKDNTRKQTPRGPNDSTTNGGGAGAALGRWLRELRPGHKPEPQTPAPPAAAPGAIERSNPMYHSEGRGVRRRKQRDNRRHSFNEQMRQRCRPNGSDIITQPQCPAAKNVSLVHKMMSARSTPNLQQPVTVSSSSTTASATSAAAAGNPSIYTYLHTQSGLNFAPVPPSSNSSAHSSGVQGRDEGSPPPTPPVRDASSIKSVKYGPGHEKFPSWPVPAAAEAPQVLRGPPSGGSHRSKSWTDHTNYPKEQVVQYTRPYMKRQHSVYTKQLKTVMERCEKIPAETFESRLDKMSDRLYFPRVDREGKALGDMDYMVPSPPERDTSKPQLTQADLEEYARSYQDPALQPELDKYSQSYQDVSALGKSLPHLTQADLEEYTRSYEEALSHQHQKQPSYAQSEGYHSYVSSSDSTATPFLDRLRRDSEATVVRPQSNVWDDTIEEREVRHEGRDSVVTTSSGSVSSSETLKWHGSMSDVSVASSSCTHLANSSNSRQLIAHSARVQTPQRHHSESVLYMGSDRQQQQQEGWKDKESRNNHHNQLKLFPVNTYTVQPTEQQQQQHTNTLTHRSSLSSQTSLSVADRVNELERQQTKYTYLDPEKKHRVSDPTLKAIQKKALLSFYERHHSSSKSSWRSEPQLAQSAVPQAPQPPPRPAPQTPSRRASCASDYASSIRKSNIVSGREQKAQNESLKVSPKHQHSNSCGSLSADLLGPVIMGPAISVDDWVPERPPKNPHLRSAYPDLFHEPRVPSPDLPPPSPPPVLEDEVFNNDEPLPPPPTEMEAAKWDSDFKSKHGPGAKLASNAEEVHCQVNGLPEQNPRHSSVRMSQRHRPAMMPPPKSQEASPIPLHPSTNPFIRSSAAHRQSFIGHSKRHSQKFINGSIAVSQKVSNGLPEPYHSEALRSYKPPAQLPSSEEKRKPPAQLPSELRNIVLDGRNLNGDFRTLQRSSVAEHSEQMPPPLHPRQTRINQSMRARIPDSSRHGAVTRNSPAKNESEKSERHSIGYTMSQSKASYLAARREREHGLPSADIGSYKRTMSPSGGALHESSKDIDTPHWARPQAGKECTNTSTLLRNNNTNATNNNLLRRASLVESKCTKKDPMLTMVLKPCDEDQPLPDILPVNAKVSATRPQYLNRSVSEDVKPMERFTRISPPRSPQQGSPKIVHGSPQISSGAPQIFSGSQQISNGSPQKSNGSSQKSSGSPQNFSGSPQIFSGSPQKSSSSPQIFSGALQVSSGSPQNCNASPISERDRSRDSPPRSIKKSPLSSPKCSPTNTPQFSLPVSQISPRSSPRSSIQLSPPAFQSPPKVVPASSPQHTTPRTSPRNTIQISQQQENTLPVQKSPSPSVVEVSNISTKSLQTSLVSSLASSTLSIPKSPVVSPPSSPTKSVSPVTMIFESSSATIANESSEKSVQKSSQIEQPKVIEGLQLIQRTEVTLRVNTCTIDAASQTEKEELPCTPLPTRRKLQEEIDCERLSQDLANHLSPSDRLKCILVPGPEHKKPTDYVSGLFKVEVTSRPRPLNSPFRSRTNTPNCSPPPSLTTSTSTSSTETSTMKSTTTELTVPILEPTSPLSATSTYFTTSESKAKFLTRYSRDMNQYNIVKDTKDLNQKKEELVNRLDKKLEVLRSEQLVVNEECRMNDELGENVERHVARVARPHEAAKFRLHVEEVGKITSLLLGLSGRLARAENALMGLPSEHSEKKILESKRDKLQEQLEEAKKLKESIDKRSVSVSNILYKYLSSEEYADYDHFINMKAKLIMDSREISDKIKLGEEQLIALKETLTVND